MVTQAPLFKPFPEGGRFDRTGGRFGTESWPFLPESARMHYINSNNYAQLSCHFRLVLYFLLFQKITPFLVFSVIMSGFVHFSGQGDEQ
jgi:hypothetical protein